MEINFRIPKHLDKPGFDQLIQLCNLLLAEGDEVSDAVKKA